MLARREALLDGHGAQPHGDDEGQVDVAHDGAAEHSRSLVLREEKRCNIIHLEQNYCSLSPSMLGYIVRLVLCVSWTISNFLDHGDVISN